MNKQPKRESGDGPVEVNRFGGVIVITAKMYGARTSVELSEYNAWRVFGMLATILGIELPKNIAEQIKF